MAYSASAGIQISLDGTTYYPLTDHNRQPFDFSYENVEKANRMADGTMRKFVVARKRKLSVSWSEIPSGTGAPYNPYNASLTYSGMTMTVDGYKGGAWIKSFYEANVFNPIYVKVTHSDDDYTQANKFYPSISTQAVETFRAFITDFNYTVKKRYTITDIVDIKLDFTEI